MKDIKPALTVSEPDKDVTVKDLHQESTLSQTEQQEQVAATASSSESVESSSIFTAENAKATASFVKDGSKDAKSISGSVASVNSKESPLGKVAASGKAVSQVETTLGNSGALSDLDTEQKSKIAMLSDVGSDAGTADVMVNGIRHQIDNGDRTSVSSITKTLNSLSGSEGFKLLDLGSELAFVGMITEKAMEWGIPELIDSAIQRLRDEKERKAQMVDALLKASRVGSVSQTRYWMGKVDSGKVRELAPTLVDNLLRYFKRPKNETEIVAGNALLSILNDLNPYWDKYKGQTTLEPYMNASTKALEVLQFTSRGKYATTQLELKFKEDPVSSIIKESFPDLDPPKFA